MTGPFLLQVGVVRDRPGKMAGPKLDVPPRYMELTATLRTEFLIAGIGAFRDDLVCKWGWRGRGEGVVINVRGGRSL